MSLSIIQYLICLQAEIKAQNERQKQAKMRSDYDRQELEARMSLEKQIESIYRSRD